MHVQSLALSLQGVADGAAYVQGPRSPPPAARRESARESLIGTLVKETARRKALHQRLGTLLGDAAAALGEEGGGGGDGGGGDGDAVDGEENSDGYQTDGSEVGEVGYY